MSAKRLPVATIPEQSLIALVRLDVVDGGCRLATPDTGRVRGEEFPARRTPCTAIAALAGRWPLQVKAGLTLPVCGLGAVATLAGSVSATTEAADRGRPARHG